MPPRPSQPVPRSSGKEAPPSLRCCVGSQPSSPPAGLSQTCPVLMLPGQGSLASSCGSGSHHGQMCFPPCHWQCPDFMGLSPKSTTQTSQKQFIKPQSDPVKILLSTSKSQLTQTAPKAFSVLQGAQLIHEIKLPDHTLADQLCPLSLSSAASRGREKQNHHPHTPQQTSQACCSLQPQRQTCLRNVQREKSHVRQVHPSLIHETASPSSVPWQKAARAAAPTGSRALGAETVPAQLTSALLQLCAQACLQQFQSSVFGLDNFSTLGFFAAVNDSCGLFFLFFLAACAVLQAANPLVCNKHSLTQTGH